MADWTRQDVACGKLSPEQAAKIFDDLGTPPEQRVTPPDLRTDEQRLIDAHFPVAKPEEFSIRYADPGQPAPPMTKELKQFLLGRPLCRGMKHRPRRIALIRSQNNHKDEGHGFLSGHLAEHLYFPFGSSPFRFTVIMPEAPSERP